MVQKAYAYRTAVNLPLVVSVSEIMSRFEMNGRTQQPSITNTNLLQTYKLRDVLEISVPNLVYIPLNTCFTTVQACEAQLELCWYDTHLQCSSTKYFQLHASFSHFMISQLLEFGLPINIRFHRNKYET